MVYGTLWGEALSNKDLTAQKARSDLVMWSIITATEENMIFGLVQINEVQTNEVYPIKPRLD